MKQFQKISRDHRLDKGEKMDFDQFRRQKLERAWNGLFNWAVRENQDTGILERLLSGLSWIVAGNSTEIL